MALNANNVRVYGDVTNRVVTWPLGSIATPSSPLLSAAPAGGYDLGWITDDGLTQSSAYQSTKKYGWQGNQQVREIRSQFEKNFTFACMEENAVVLGLAYPSVTPTTTGATAEVQTVTITGTPTGGTFPLVLTGYGTYTAAYNVTTSALQTALITAFGLTGITVSGTAGASYVITFPSSSGNVPTISTSGGSLTGGTTPTATVATTTPGVSGITTRGISASAAQNLRQWGLYMSDGPYQKLLFLPNSEAVLTGDVPLKGTDDTVYSFTLDTYPDSTGVFFYEISNNPAVGAGLFA